MNKIALSLENVRIRYGAIEAVRGIDMEIREGDAVALLGANGAGKSSVIRAISGVTPLTEGKIKFYGQDISNLPAEKITKLGISQSPEGRQIFSQLTVEENLQVGAYCLKDKAQIKRNFERVYGYFPILFERKTQLAGTMSGGELQMLAIARALMNNPKIILFDEPSLGLAPLIVRDMFRVIKEIKEEGITVILIEQNALQSLKTVDYAYVMAQGAIKAQGISADLMKDSALLSTYLGIQ